MIMHEDHSDNAIHAMIKNGLILWGGNKACMIFGLLRCSSGKRMKKENRVFFHSATEAINCGFRPCGHCCRVEYLEWKKHI
jgi:methylphosphotriester-DNA--protein-cysteine methyltransferase